MACVGTPFHLSQRTVGAGMDCAGLVWHVAAACGIPMLPPVRYSARQTFGARVYEATRDTLDEIPHDEVQEGSVVLFTIRRPHIPQHLAIYAGGGKMIHAYPEAKGVVRSTLGAYWQHRIAACFDFRTTLTPAHRAGPRYFRKGCHGNDSTGGTGDDSGRAGRDVGRFGGGVDNRHLRDREADEDADPDAAAARRAAASKRR